MCADDYEQPQHSRPGYGDSASLLTRMHVLIGEAEGLRSENKALRRGMEELARVSGILHNRSCEEAATGYFSGLVGNPPVGFCGFHARALHQSTAVLSEC